MVRVLAVAPAWPAKPVRVAKAATRRMLVSLLTVLEDGFEGDSA